MGIDIISLGYIQKMMSIAKGSPRGTYATVEALTLADPSHDFTYLVVATGSWYYWDATEEEWTLGGVYQDSAAFNELAGAGRTTETVKANADAIALRVETSAVKATVSETPLDTNVLSELYVDTRFKALEASRIHRYGMKTNKVTGTHTRLYDAVGKTFRRQVDTIDEVSDFTALYPWSNMKTVKVNAARDILSIIGDANWDTTDADEMVLCPTCWSKRWEDATDEYVVVADAPFEDYLPVGFINPNGTVKKYSFIGAVHTSNVAAVPYSKAGVMPKYNHPLYHATTGFQIDATNKGTGWSNIDTQAFELLTRLLDVELGSHDVKTLVGQGINGMTNSYSALNVCTVATENANTFIMATARSAYFKVGMMVQIGTSYTTNALAANRYITEISEPVEGNVTVTVDGAVFTTTTSSTIATWGQPLPEAQLQALKNESGYVLQFGAENLSHVCYRGVWDFWGNMWQYLSGLTRYDLQFYVCHDITKMNVNDPRNVAGWIPTGIAPNIANGYLKTRQTYRHPSGEIGLPYAVGAGATTWWSVYLYYFNSDYMGIRAVLFGGSWNSGSYVSPFFWLGDTSPASALIYFGGRLIC